MDGGIIEASLLDSMMTGAAVGGGSSLLQGKDPLQGALLGGLMGGAVSGIGGALGGAPTGAMPGASAATPAAAAPVANTVAEGLPTPATFDATGKVTNIFNPSAYDSAPTPTSSYDSFGGAAAAGSPAATMADPTGLAQQQMAANAAQAPANQGIMGRAGQFFKDLTPNQQLLAGGAGIAGLGMIRDQMRGGVPKQAPYSGQLSRFKYNPDTYRSYFSRGFAAGGDTGGIASLGSYSDGGRMLKGPGDGMSDNIPATIGGKQPARLADGEFVVPADVVSHLGNGSTDAGAKQLYSMMNKVRQARTGNSKQGKQIQPRKYLPA
jgi:hypothetical protein